MTVAKFQQPNYNTDTGSAYPLALDGNMSVLARLGAAYAPHAEDAPTALKVVVDAGALFVSGALVANAAQTVTLATAHATLPRIDRVVIDMLTGVASKVDGTAAGSPAAPAIPAGKLPVAQVLVEATGTVITNSKITDERVISLGYEAGTWTPDIGGTATYTSRGGDYVKYGKAVFFRGALQVNALGTGSTRQIAGLPYAVAGGKTASASIAYWGALATAVVSLIASLDDSTVSLNGLTAAVASSSSGATNLLGNGSSVAFSGLYLTA
jgi:hypothetical protein